MSLWRQVTRGIDALLDRTEQDRGIDDEVRHYFEEPTAAYKERGLSEEDARRAVRRELGNPNATQERTLLSMGKHGQNISLGLALRCTPTAQESGVHNRD
jgi:hypothetical protein